MDTYISNVRDLMTLIFTNGLYRYGGGLYILLEAVLCIHCGIYVILMTKLNVVFLIHFHGI